MSWTVYEIVCLVNGKSYIGITSKSVAARWAVHCTPSSGCLRLRNAIQKHGHENFTIEALCIVASRPEADALEKYLISDLRANEPSAGYNIADGGEGRQLSLYCGKGLHIGEERGSGPACEACRVGRRNTPEGMASERARGATYRALHPERVRAKRRKSRAANPGKANSATYASIAKLRRTNPTEAKRRKRVSHLRSKLKAVFQDFTMASFMSGPKAQKAAYG